MKTQKSIHAHSIPRLLLMVPVICSMAFAACSNVAGTEGMHPAVNLQSSVIGKPQTGDNVTIKPRTYDSESRSFDRLWPGVVVVYTPRDEHELSVCQSLFRISYNFSLSERKKNSAERAALFGLGPSNLQEPLAVAQ